MQQESQGREIAEFGPSLNAASAGEFAPGLSALSAVAARAIGVIALAAFFPCAAYAEDARVLPKGVSRFSLTVAMTGAVENDYNGDGKIESVAGKYNMELNAANLSKLAPAFRQLVGVLNNSSPGAGDELTAGALELSATGHRQTYALAEQYGLTDRLSIGVQVPIIRAQIEVRKSLVGVNNANQLASKYVPTSSEEVKSGLNSVASASIPLLENELTKLGYAPVKSSDKFGLGDVVVGGRYAWKQDDITVGSFQLGATAPTGAVPEPGDLIAQPFGDGAWEIGAAHLFQWSPVHWLILGQGLHYSYKAPDHRRFRVPESESDILPGAETERLVQRKGGDKTWASASVGAKASKELMFELGYEWYWRFPTRFYELAGSRIAAYSDGLHYSETASLQLTYSTISLFMAKKFPMPMNFLVTLYQPIRGKNSLVAQYATAELALFF